MTIQEKILNQLPLNKKEDLMQSQINEAKSILFRTKLKLESYSLVTLTIKEVIPSQQGEDYKNASSEYDVSVYQAVMNRKMNINDIRLNTFRPIAVDKNTMKIIDGNHRHYAIKTVGEKDIFVLLCETQNIE
jgi:hypothetical protein